MADHENHKEIAESRIVYTVIITAIIFLVAAVFLKKNYALSATTSSNDITVMTYNAENLFDTIHDEGKNDYTYMPLSFKKANPAILEENCPDHEFFGMLCREADWSKERLKEKLKRFSKAILTNTNGQGPDILLLQEVENMNVLNMLKEKLNNKVSGAKYLHTILVEGHDERGIDTAILSKLPLLKNTEPILHNFDLPGAGFTRGILQADFALKNDKSLTVLNFHLPSQRNPVSHREAGFNKLNELAKKIIGEHPERYIIAGGDSNITEKEHHVFTDITEELFKDSLEYTIKSEDTVEGTHFYKGNWSMLDVFLISRNLVESTGPYKIDALSFRIPTEYEKQKYVNKQKITIPSRYAHPNYYGVSDHFPVLFKIVHTEPIAEKH